MIEVIEAFAFFTGIILFLVFLEGFRWRTW